MASEDPPERDMKDFEFIQLCKFKVSQSTSEFPPSRSQLLASSSLFGLLFYAFDEETPGFKVVKTSELLAIDQSKGKERNKVTVTEFPIEAKVALPGIVEYLGISADDLTLAIVLKEVGQLNILFFDVRSFGNKLSSVLPFAKSVVNASPNICVVDLEWNPTIGSMLAVCLSDNSLQLLEVTGQAKILASLPSSIGASCFSWSPKGKQLLVGKRDGSLAQYDHSLTEKRKWPCPTVLTTPHTVVDVVWISTYSFLAGYLPIGAPAADQPIVILTQSNKENNSKYINFDDPCFGNGEERKPHFLFHFVQKWEMVVLASSRASEATIIGKNLDDKASWEHWNLDDCARAELPLTASQNDSYPLGLAVDYSPQNQVVLSEIKTIPACPVMFILSNDGLLLSYHLSYTHKDAPPVTTVPQALDPSAARKGVPGLVSKPSQQPTVPALAPATTAPFGAPPSQPQVQQARVPQSQPTQAPPPSTSFPGVTASAAPKPTFAFGAANDLFPSGQKPPPFFGTTPSQPTRPPLVPPNATAPSFSFTMGGPAANKGPSSAFVSLSPATTSSAPQQAQTTPASSFGQPLQPTANVNQLSNLQSKPATQPDAGARTQPLPPGGAQQATPSTSAPFPGLFSFVKKPGEIPVEAKGPVPGASPGQNLPRTTPDVKAATPLQGPRFPPPAAPTAALSQPIAAGGNSAGGAFGAHLGIGGAPPAYPSQQGGQLPSAQARDLGTSGSANQMVESKSTIKATVDSAFTQNITEEIADFELEMKELMNRSKQGMQSVGNTSELHSLRQDVEKMSSFINEIKDATKDQMKECQDLKSTCYNLLYMAEECNTLHQRNNDPHYHSLLQGRALDPVTAEKLKSLQQMAQSVESTVVDVDHVLDSQWNDHLNKEKEKMTTSAGDAIYKTIKNNHWLITDQRGRLEKLEEQIRSVRLQSKARKSEKGSPFTLLPETNRSMQRPDVKASPSLETTQTTMTPEKLSRLKDYLLQRKVPVVKPSTPADLSMSRIVSQSAKKTPSTSLKTTPQQSADAQQSTHLSRWLPSNVNQQQQQQQTPSSTPVSAQLRLAKGILPESSNLPAFQKAAGAPVAPGQSLKIGQPTPDGSSPQRSGPPSQAPTAFSGVAYFKQPQQAQSPAIGQGTFPRQQPQSTGHQGLLPSTQGTLAGQHPQLTMGQGALAGQHPQSALGQTLFAGQQLPPEVQAAAQVLSTHMGSAMRPDGPLAHLPQLLSAAAASVRPLAQHQQQQQSQLIMQNLYEDITPTETDETNDDDDDDYDEEDNGYEDEDEDEVGLGFDGRVSDPNGFLGRGNANAYSQPPQQVAVSAAALSAASKNLFGTSKFTSPASGLGDQGSSKAASPPNKTESKPSLFTPPKFSPTTTTSSFNFGFTGTSSSTASSTSTASVFSGKPAFSFGGSGMFGQKAPGNLPVGSGDTSVFGSMATPSKAVGFGDVASQDTKAAQTKPASTVSQPSVAPKDAPDAGNKVATTTSASASLFSSGTTTTPSASASSVSSSSMTAFSFGGSKSQPGNTPLFGAGTKTSPDLTVKTSPFAGQSTSTGFSIFGGNKAASPPGSKTGFDAVLSATSPTTKTGATGFNFSPNANNLPSSGGLFGPQSPTSEAATVSTPTAETSVSTSGKGQTSDQTTSKTFASDASSNPAAVSSTSWPAQDEPSNSSQRVSQEAASVSISSSGAPAGDASRSAPTLGSLLAESSPSIGNASATTASSGFTFGSAGTSIFTPSKSPAMSTSTKPSSPFGNESHTSAPTAAPLFGNVSQSTATSTSGSPFGIATTTMATTTTLSPQGNVPLTTAAPTASALGSTGQATTSLGVSLFGNAAQAPSATTGASGFGSPTLPNASAASSTMFSSASKTTATPSFGNSPPISGFGSVFGSTTSAATSLASAPAFGTTATSTSAKPLFGSTAATTMSTTLFSGGDGNTATSGSQSVFSGSSIFGTPTTTSASVFGGGSSFVTSTTAAGSSLFGTKGTTSASSVPSFGFGTSSPASGGGLFGTSSTSNADGKILFFKPAGGLFGNPSSSGSLFGQASAPSESQAGSVFGQGSQSSSLFGGSGEGFGLGGKPSEEKAKQNVFGSVPQTFGSENNEQNSLFGSGGSSTFGTVGMGSSFGAGSPSGGAFSSSTQSGVSSTGFGVSAATGNSPGFGAAPTFGGTPGFGTSSFGSGGFGAGKPTFGSGPSFGGGSSFGATPSFSSPGSSSVFGSAPSENAGFSSFASAPAPSFGQLAQSSSPSAFGSGSEVGFGSSQAPAFGSAGGGGGPGSGGFGSFGASPGFGQASPGPAFGSGQSTGFGGGSSFGSSPAFSSYRG